MCSAASSEREARVSLQIPHNLPKQGILPISREPDKWNFVISLATQELGLGERIGNLANACMGGWSLALNFLKPTLSFEFSSTILPDFY